MSRLFSIIRRRPNLIDLITTNTAGIPSYRIKWAQNFDGVFATLFTAPLNGYLDPAVNQAVLQQVNNNDAVRIVFDPATFSIDDTLAFWIQLARVDASNVETLVGPPHLVLPDSANHGVGVVTIHGAAPAGTSSAASVALELPGLMQDFKIHNEDTANYLYVASEIGGPEQQLRPDTFPQYSNILGTQATLCVRGATPVNVGAAVNFSATFTLAFPR